MLPFTFTTAAASRLASATRRVVGAAPYDVARPTPGTAPPHAVEGVAVPRVPPTPLELAQTFELTTGPAVAVALVQGVEKATGVVAQPIGRRATGYPVSRVAEVVVGRRADANDAKVPPVPVDLTRRPAAKLAERPRIEGGGVRSDPCPVDDPSRDSPTRH